MKTAWTRAQWLCVAYAIAHLLSHFAAKWFEVRPGISVSVWYAPCGLALSLLVLLGLRYTPVVFVVNCVVAWVSSPDRALWTGFFFPALVTVNYAGAAWLVRRFIGPRLLPGSPRETLGFCLAIGAAPLFSAVVGTATITLVGSGARPANVAEFARSVFDWWIGDAAGLLTVVPVAMVFVGPWLEGRPFLGNLPRWSATDLAFALLRTLVLIGTLAAVLAVPVLREHRVFYLCFLPLVWICVHHGLPGATLATLFVMLLGLVGMRLAGTTAEFSYIYLLFAVAVAGVGLGLGTLVSRRDEAEQRLAASQAQLNRVIAGAQLGLWDWDIPAQRLESNQRLAALLGYAAGEVEALNEGWPQLIHPADGARVREALREHLAGRTGLYETEYRLRGKDGHWRWIHSRGSIVARDGRQQPVRVSGTHLDITERERAEAEIARLLKIIEATPDLVLTTDANGRVIFANAALHDLWGRNDPAAPAPGRLLTELFPGEAGRRLREEAIPGALKHGAWQGELVLTNERGQSIPTSQVVLAHRDEENDTSTLSFIMRDTSDQKRAEAERIEHERKLLQLQKAESLSVLAGGIAHDFNNLLTAVVGNANLARFETEPGTSAHGFLLNIEQAAARAAALCQQMLAYAGRTPVSFAELDLNRVIDDALVLLRPGVGKKITLQFDGGPPLPAVLAASTQLQQLVTNLVLNAVDAIGEREGRVTLRTHSQVFDAAELGRLFPGQNLAAGAYVVLEVEDNGCGMTPETQAKIFEPFFTTKFAGQGLGLAAVIGVVRSHRGAIAVRTAPDAGATFRVAFPAVAARPQPAPARPAADQAWRGSGFVLVVDDERLIRQVLTLQLERLGFSVVLANDGVEGVAAFREHADRLRCVLLDLTMPRMDGFEAHAQMHRHNPKVPVVLISGYSQKLAHLPPEAVHPAGVLAKPFTLTQLRARLEAVLAGN